MYQKFQGEKQIRKKILERRNITYGKLLGKQEIYSHIKTGGGKGNNIKVRVTKQEINHQIEVEKEMSGREGRRPS